MQKLAEICVRRPVFATVIILALTVIGGFSFFTLGVDRYTQKDVVEVARCFTGWTTPEPSSTDFRFDPAMHDPGDKVVFSVNPSNVPLFDQGTGQRLSA